MGELQPDCRTALLVGATGLIGARVLTELLASDCYARVVVQVRNPNKITLQHPKLRILPFGINELPEPVNDFYCALGTTQKQSGKDGLVDVDRDLVVTSASLALAAGAGRASVVSAIGASVASPFFYNRIKGEMEEALLALNFDCCIFWQPSVLLGKRPGDFRLAERLTGRLLNSKWFGRYQALPGDRVGCAMVAVTPMAQDGIFRYKVPQIKAFTPNYSSIRNLT